MDEMVRYLQYLLSSSDSWVTEENLYTSYPLLVASFSENASEGIIKIEECSDNIHMKQCQTLEKITQDRKETFTNGLLTKDGGKNSVECEECHQKFAHKGNLTIHQRAYSGEKPFKCSIYGKLFNLKPKQNTRNTPSHESPFVCVVCEKYFRRRDTLRRHMAIHSGVKPYLCNSCGMSFLEKGTLKRHETTHTKEEKPFQCDRCIRTFHTKSALSEHDFSHTGISRHFCDICGVYYSNSGTLKKHIKNLHVIQDNKPAKPVVWNCEKCGQAFPNEAKLIKHATLQCYYTALEALRTKRLGVKPSS